MGKTLERNIINQQFFVNAEYDTTHGLEFVAYDWIDYTTELGIPSLVKFYITKNKNTNLTDENGLLNVEIPVFPAYVKSSSSASKDMEEFIVYGLSQDYKNFKQTKVGDVEIKQRKANFAKKVVNYIRYEIAERYYIAMKSGDEKTMNFLKSLDVMKGFDFEKYLHLKGGSVPESKYPVTYMGYLKFKDKLPGLRQALAQYKDYDVIASRGTVPSHSVLLQAKKVGVIKTSGKKLQPTNMNAKYKKQ